MSGVNTEPYPGTFEEAFERCGVEFSERTPDNFFFEKAEDGTIYPIRRELVISDEYYELTERGAVISHDAEVMEGVEVGARTIVEKHAKVLGSSVLARECEIAKGATVNNSELQPRVVVGESSKVVDSEIEDSSVLKSFVRIKDSNLGFDNEIGENTLLDRVETGPEVRIGVSNEILNTTLRGGVITERSVLITPTEKRGVLNRGQIAGNVRILKGANLKGKCVVSKAGTIVVPHDTPVYRAK